MTIKQLVKPPSLMLSHLVVPHWTHHFQVGGWPTPLKNHGVKVSWDDDIPFPTFHGKSIQIPWFQSPPTSYYNHQPTITYQLYSIISMVTMSRHFPHGTQFGCSVPSKKKRPEKPSFHWRKKSTVRSAIPTCFWWICPEMLVHVDTQLKSTLLVILGVLLPQLGNMDLRWPVLACSMEHVHGLQFSHLNGLVNRTIFKTHGFFFPTWLVVDLLLWKIMEWKSVGTMTFHSIGKSIQIPWFQ